MSYFFSSSFWLSNLRSTRRAEGAWLEVTVRTFDALYVSETCKNYSIREVQVSMHSTEHSHTHHVCKFSETWDHYPLASPQVLESKTIFFFFVEKALWTPSSSKAVSIMILPFQMLLSLRHESCYFHFYQSSSHSCCRFRWRFDRRFRQNLPSKNLMIWMWVIFRITKNTEWWITRHSCAFKVIW